MFSFIVWLNLAQHASFLLAVWRYVTAECAQTKDTNGFQRAFNPHRLGRQLFTLVSFTLEPLGGSRKFVKHVLCRTQIKIPCLLAFWVQCRSRCSNDLLQPKISPKLSYYKCPAKPESLLNFPKARFLQQSDRLSLIDIYIKTVNLGFVSWMMTKLQQTHIRLTTAGQHITETAVVGFNKSNSYTECEVVQIQCLFFPRWDTRPL